MTKVFNSKKSIIVSGFKPSGELQIGNYLGALRSALQLQDSNKNECFYFVADYHSLTQKYNPESKKEEIYKMAVDLLAIGLDPEKSTIFIQSHVPEHANLAWILNTITPVGRLQGMIEYKEKLSQGQAPNMGLFDYPVLQSADILLYKAEAAPVGDDQKQHLELTRDLARIFNDRFGKTFKEPKAILTKTPRIMSLDNPNKKMSKSLPRGCLYLSDSPKIIREKIKSAVTDSGREIIYSPENKPSISSLLLIYSEFSGDSVKELEKRFRGISYSEFKMELAELVVNFLIPIQKKREELVKNRGNVLKILEVGALKAQVVAQKTMEEVKKNIGLA